MVSLALYSAGVPFELLCFQQLTYINIVYTNYPIIRARDFQNMAPFKVQLALYDLSRGMARSMSYALLGKQVDGIWHTGIIVYGKEHFFSGGLQTAYHEDFVRSHGGFR
jgi:PPPDE putative peptidase domain